MSIAAERARNGSKRQRDLAALQAEQAAEHAIPSTTQPSDAATEAWAEVISHAYGTFHRSALHLWIEPCELVGVDRGALVIAGRHEIAEWVRRRYARKLGKWVRELTGFKGLIVCDRSEA